MKLYKLLLFLLALVSLNSCAEQTDNGIEPEPDKPEEEVYAAEVANPEEAKYVGDKFVFKAMLNNIDVTAKSKFKVNGVPVAGDTDYYIPHKAGEHSVIATMNNYTADFKFTVLEEGDDPEETGNRIEYDGNSYTVSETVWALALDENDEIYKVPVKGVDFCAWLMQSTEYDTNGKELHQFYNIVLAPIDNGSAFLPFAKPNDILNVEGGGVLINGEEVFEIDNVDYTFANSGNTIPTGNAGTKGTANYTGLAKDEGNDKSAKLFWNGDYLFATFKIQSPKGAKTINSLKNIELVATSKDQIKNLKIAK